VSLYASYDMQWCDKCHGQRPHSKRGRCLSAHRAAPLATVTPMKRTQWETPKQESQYAELNRLAELTDEERQQLSAPSPAYPRTPKPPIKVTAPARRKFDQPKVRAAVASLLAGEATLQQAARDADCDTDYLHRRAWTAAKDATSKRDDGACQYPGCTTEGWIKDTHHRVTKGSGGTSNPLVAYYLPNLITLCRHHHQHVTLNPTAGETLGLVIPRLPPVDPATIPAYTIHGPVMYEGAGRRLVAPPGDPT
jgi:hypothetical protein